MNWRLPSQKILFTAAVDDTIPIGHQILEHILHYHINDKVSRISFDKTFQGRHNSIPHLSNFPSRKLNLMSILYEKIFHGLFNFHTQDENPIFFLLIRNSISKKVRVYKKQVTAEIYGKENRIQKRHHDGDFLWYQNFSAKMMLDPYLQSLK